MARKTHTLTFAVTYFKDDASEVVQFGIGFNPDEQTGKEAATVHCADKHAAIATGDLAGFVPKFRTYQELRVLKMSDLDLR